MSKQQIEPGTNLYPVPAVMVSCKDEKSRPNIITIAWTGIMASRPPTVGIGVRRSRHSYGLIKNSGEFVINIPVRDQLEALDVCGTLSGRKVDKFAEAGLTALPPKELQHAPLIAECPLNLECRVAQVLPLGSHDFFVAEIVAVHANDEWLDGGSLRPVADDMITYARSTYYGVAEKLGDQGFSMKKP